MEIFLISISSLTLIVISIFLFYYSKTEKKNKDNITNQFNLLSASLKSDFENGTRSQLEIIADISKKQNEKFESLSKDVRVSQEQANTKINDGFEHLQKENSNIQKEVKDKVADIKNSFKDYSQKVDAVLAKYSDDLYQTQLDSNRIKEEMQTEINRILKEIKAPLDLD